MPLEALIFDMDGVVADTIELHYRAWLRLTHEEGIPFDRQQNERLRGLSRRTCLDLLFGPLDEPTAAALMTRKNGYFHELLAVMTPADCAPGVKSLIEAGRAAGLKIGLASSSQNVYAVLGQLDLLDAFDAIGDRFAVVHAKPAPDIFLWVAGRLGVYPGRSLVFEDAEAGVAAARAGGFPVIGVGDPAIVGAADWVVPSLADVALPDLLARVPIA